MIDKTDLGKTSIQKGLDAIARQEPLIAAAIHRVGYPEPRVRKRGYATMLRTIIGQQVSVAAANSVWTRMESLLGQGMPVDALLAADDEQLRQCGLSRQKQAYVRSLTHMVASGDIDFLALPTDDEEAIAELTQIKGVGRWSAEIYLLFADRREDIWPAGDLAVRAGLQMILGLESRPHERDVRALAEQWRPYRSALALFVWHCYNNPTL